MDKKTGELRYLSASGSKKGDMSSDQGCARAWYYQYREGKKEPSTKAQIEGQKDHAVAEKYLMTGVRVLSPRLAKGLHMLPPPGAGLWIETDMVPVMPDGSSGLHLSPLRAAGIPFVGRIDLMHDLGINYGADNAEEMRDPEGTIEIFDHKFVSRLDYAKKGPELLKDIQMVAYGEYVYTVIPDVQRVRLSHGYYPTTGNARKATVLTDRTPLDKYWTEHVEPLARFLRDVAKEPTADTVPANTRACRAFNRECVHASYCSAGMQGALASLVGQTAAQNLLKNINKEPMPLIPGKTLLSHIKKSTAAAPDTAAKEAEIAKLKAEELEAKRKRLVPAGFDKLVADIEAHNVGFPGLGGPLAQIYAAFKGEDKTSYDGVGQLAEVIIASVDELKQVLEELSETSEENTTEVSAEPSDSLTPPEAPEPTTAPPNTVTYSTSESAAEVQAHADATKALADTAAAAEAPKPKRTRAPKAPKAEPTTVMVETNLPGAQQEIEIAARAASVAAGTTINLLVDVVMDGGAFHNLAPFVDRVAGSLAQRFNLDDCRLGDAQSAIGFGKWKAAIAAMVREVGMEPGNYYLDARGNEIYEEAAQAMRTVCRASGGWWARGAGR